MVLSEFRMQIAYRVILLIRSMAMRRSEHAMDILTNPLAKR
jgi:hypothetical protein